MGLGYIKEAADEDISKRRFAGLVALHYGSVASNFSIIAQSASRSTLQLHHERRSMKDGRTLFDVFDVFDILSMSQHRGL